MTDILSLADQIKVEAARAWAAAGTLSAQTDAAIATLEKHIHDAEAREHRRAAFNHIDRRKYAIGGGFEPVGGLDLDPVALTGLLALGLLGHLLLLRVAMTAPEASTVKHYRLLFASKAGRMIRQQGVFIRWTWLRDLYVEETETFFASKKGRNPNARWRAEKATVNQGHLIVHICLLLQIEQRSFPTRGDAHDWIKLQGGNARFWEAPNATDLAALEATLR